MSLTALAKKRMTIESILSRCQPVIDRWKGKGMKKDNPLVAGVSFEELERDVASLCEFITEEIEIVTDPEFRVKTSREKIPAAYTSAHRAVDAMLHQARKKGGRS